MSPFRSGRAVTVGALVAAAALLLGTQGGATAGHEPANKVSASGSTAEVFGPGETVTILNEFVKTSAPTDLILGVSLECSLLTEVTTVGSEESEAFGQIRVWVEIDGRPVPVSTDDKGGGRVVFCNRAHRQTTQLGSDDDSDSITTHLSTRTANAFNWLALNVGSQVHNIQVKAELTETTVNKATAEAVIGNRTLIVEPVKAANDETVQPLGK